MTSTSTTVYVLGLMVTLINIIAGHSGT